MSQRLDIYLAEKKLADSRSRAQWMIAQGMVLVNGKTVSKTSALVGQHDQVQLTEQPAYISFGGYKLAHAAEELHIGFNGKTVLDIGASTGGFTDYALKNGAIHVTCIDAGNEQLHTSLRQNPQVIFYEQTDIRQFHPNQLQHGLPDLILADLSFISIKKVADDLLRFVSEKTELLVLVKPQFEMEQRINFKNGIVPKKYHAAILKTIENTLAEKGLHIKGISATEADGKNRNIEYFLHLAKKP